MKTLFIDCGMGAAGDMLSAALLELLPDPDAFVNKINALNIPGVEISAEPSVKCGITGTHYSVKVGGIDEGDMVHEHHHEHEHHHHHEHKHEHEHHHHHHDHEHGHGHHHEHEHHHDHEHHHHHDHEHHSLADINNIIAGFDIPENVKSDINAVYTLIAEAESAAHGCEISQIHFHEVGTMDAIADITSFCMLINELKPKRIVASPICTGYGHVHCAHGILPVPAPATAFILKDVPVYSGKIEGELCTPTGAALLKHFADSFEQMPTMKVEKIGYGMGKKDFAAANCVRAMIGDADSQAEEICEISFNVDDMTAEDISFASERLFDAGAREVFTTAVGMKKSRPGTLFTVLFEEKIRDDILSAIFTHTTTIGVREVKTKRYTLSRKEEKLETKYGPVTVKISSGYGVERCKIEHDDLVRIALENSISIEEARNNINNH